MRTAYLCMTLNPETVLDLQAALARCYIHREKITGVDLSRIKRLLDHVPEDLTATVEAGMPLSDFQEILKPHGQWLPVDPPNPARLTIGDLVLFNQSGSRRLGYGTIRDHVIGMSVVLADGRLVKAGGKVVKNVAGYDLCKLFIGSRGTIGIIVDVTFKLSPLPEAEVVLETSFTSVRQAEACLERIGNSPIQLSALDLHNLSGSRLTCVAALAGAEEDVADQQAQLGDIAPFREADADLSHNEQFWHALGGEPVRRASVLPSRLFEELARIKPQSFLVRAGNGEIFYRGGSHPPAPRAPANLMRKVKQTYDPANILPDFWL